MTNQSNFQKNSNQGFIAEARVFVSQDGQYITHVLPGEIRIREHINRYKGILKLPFEKKSQSDSFYFTGMLAKTSIFLSRDGNFLVHNFPGGRISKHINYYKKILGVLPQATPTQAA